MRKKNCFKKLGAVVMAVAMTAMMIPGVVSAGTSNEIKLELTEPVVGEEPVIPKGTTQGIAAIETETYAILFGGEMPDEDSVNHLLGWTDSNGKALTGKFETGKTYKFTAIVHKLGNGEVNPTTTKVFFGTKQATKIAQGDDGANTLYFYQVQFTLGETTNTNKITDGDDNETIKATTGKDLVLKCEKNLPDEGFKFYFGGKELTSNECKVEKGSTIVTVYASYLDTLPGGDYEVTFAYPDGNITNTVTLTKAAAEEKAPQTGEFSSMATTVLLISILGLVGLGFYAKKKEFF